MPKEFKDLDDFEKFEIINEINEFFLQDEITIKKIGWREICASSKQIPLPQTPTSTQQIKQQSDVFVKTIEKNEEAWKGNLALRVKVSPMPARGTRS